MGVAAELDVNSARRLCLLRAVEAGPPDAALWSPEDAAWASRLADESTDATASDATWLAERARHAQQRILPRRAALARAFARRGRMGQWALLAAVAGGAFGVLADMAGGRPRIDLLAVPVWAVVAWNLVVYAWIAVATLRAPALGEGRAAQGPIRRTVWRWLRGAQADEGVAGEAPRAARTPEQRFLAEWRRTVVPLAWPRAALLLHIAAAALALGLVAGLYARALVLDYRVAWQSTLLEPAQVHAALAWLLAPASAATGIPIPGLEAVAALRTAADVPLAPGAGAFGAGAPWLHLLAATLMLAVVVPRLVLAALAAAAAWRRARRLPVTVDDAHSLRLLQSRRRHAGAGSGGGVQVLPHGFTPEPGAVLALRQVLAATFGERAPLDIAAPTLYGDEDSPLPPAREGAIRCIAWFDLAATPEAQAQGRFVERLQARADAPAVLLLVDESGYRQRLGMASARLAERRSAWQVFADAAGAGLACIDLCAAAEGPEALDRARRALESALAVRNAARLADV